MSLLNLPPERVAGVDEAGRGPLAGPVVVAAVILDPSRPIDGLNDSKALSERQRELLFDAIQSRVLAFSIIAVEVAEIEQHNILQATLIGMERALRALQPVPLHALIDGNKGPPTPPCPVTTVVNGDAIEPAIMAASILAKVSRDRVMRVLEQRFPGYGFGAHKGYPVPTHFEALQRLGPCPAHRHSFAPVRAAASVGPSQADLLP
jgi:ribonuclease HII